MLQVLMQKCGQRNYYHRNDRVKARGLTPGLFHTFTLFRNGSFNYFVYSYCRAFITSAIAARSSLAAASWLGLKSPWLALTTATATA